MGVYTICDNFENSNILLCISIPLNYKYNQKQFIDMKINVGNISFKMSTIEVLCILLQSSCPMTPVRVRANDDDVLLSKCAFSFQNKS